MSSGSLICFFCVTYSAIDSFSCIFYLSYCIVYLFNFPDGLDGKRLPTMWETWVRSLGREEPLEKEMATHSSILAWKIPWTEEPGRLQSMESQRVEQD